MTTNEPPAPAVGGRLWLEDLRLSKDEALALAVDRACSAYEQDWWDAHRRGEPEPTFDVYLDQAAPAHRHALTHYLQRLCKELPHGCLPSIPGYALGERLGSGGFGDVYRARDLSTNTEVAVKILRDGELCRGPRLEAIWEAEGDVVTGLCHPNIVRIERFGHHDGGRYVVMELVLGGDLREQIADYTLASNALQTDERARRREKVARLLEKVSRAVHHVHQRGVIHRDLKPANVLLDGDEPKVCDFGLARRVAEPLCITRTGQVLGTWAYMAPEQTQAGPLTVLADVWALGAILYELLTGHAPFTADAPDLLELLRRKAECDLARLDLPGEDPDLEWICLKCLHRDPAARFGSAEALADALARYQRGERVGEGVTLGQMAHRWLIRPVNREPADPHYIERWKGCLRIEACTSLLCHTGVFWLVWQRTAGWQLWLWLLCLDTMTGWLIYSPGMLRRRLSAMEQQVAQMWLGADFAAVTLLLVFCPPWQQADPVAAGRFYAAYAVVRGLIFVVEGRVCWGRLYFTGFAFFAAAVGMSLVPEVAPLVHGAAYSGWILWLSCRRWGRDTSGAPPSGAPCPEPRTSPYCDDIARATAHSSESAPEGGASPVVGSGASL
ncbi:MAG: serine/threonine-protein kinase [Gemmataceae bacterium]